VPGLRRFNQERKMSVDRFAEWATVSVLRDAANIYEGLIEWRPNQIDFLNQLEAEGLLRQTSAPGWPTKVWRATEAGLRYIETHPNEA
jgi:hypothetical protein